MIPPPIDPPSPADPSERLAELYMDGWSGRTAQLCVVIGETPMRYRVRPVYTAGVLRLGGRRREIRTGETALVPKRAITLLHLGAVTP
jgi:hypothetical protein